MTRCNRSRRALCGAAGCWPSGCSALRRCPVLSAKPSGQAFGRGLIDPMVMGYDHFRRDLERTLADPERMAGFEYDQIGPLEDAIGELSGWDGFSDAAQLDQGRRGRTTGPRLAL